MHKLFLDSLVNLLDWRTNVTVTYNIRWNTKEEWGKRSDSWGDTPLKEQVESEVKLSWTAVTQNYFSPAMLELQSVRVERRESIGAGGETWFEIRAVRRHATPPTTRKKASQFSPPPRALNFGATRRRRCQNGVAGGVCILQWKITNLKSIYYLSLVY